MKLRHEAYLHACSLPDFTEQERVQLRNCVADSDYSVNFIESRLEDISSNIRAVDSGSRLPLTCSIYYAMAKSTTNLLTVQLSLQLGDLWFLKKFEEYYSSLDFEHFRLLKEESKRCINYLKEGLSLNENPATIIG